MITNGKFQKIYFGLLSFKLEMFLFKTAHIFFHMLWKSWQRKLSQEQSIQQLASRLQQLRPQLSHLSLLVQLTTQLLLTSFIFHHSIRTGWQAGWPTDVLSPFSSSLCKFSPPPFSGKRSWRLMNRKMSSDQRQLAMQKTVRSPGYFQGYGLGHIYSF